MQKIIVAAGIEIRDFQGANLLTFLNATADDQGGSRWTFPKGPVAKAQYEVTVVFTMAEFTTALDTADAYVIYEGHSRYGQGPAFGPAKTAHVPDKKAFPVNPWGVHYRMGFDATDSEAVGDLLEHSVNPTEYDLTTSPAKAFLPAELVTATADAKEVERRRKAKTLTKAEKSKPCSVKGAWRAFDTCEAALAATKTARDDVPLKGRHYYRQKPRGAKSSEYLVAVTVGSANLDTSSLKCKVLFMASCSSEVHFRKPLQRRRKAAKSSCKFYMTALVCATNHGKTFIEQVFKGHDPTSKKGSKAILKALNGVKDSGIVGIF